MNTITGAGGSSAGKKLLLVDGHSILNRAFYGMPDLTNAKGVHTGAVYGFLNILFSQIDELQPDYLTVAFDVHQIHAGGAPGTGSPDEKNAHGHGDPHLRAGRAGG